MKTLTQEEIRRVAPSVFAQSPWHERTDKYKFVSTPRVIDAMTDSGYYPVKAQQSNSRIPGKREFTKHMLKFRSKECEGIQINDVIPEIVLVNSHDGTSAYKMMFGLFRLVCTNGLIVADSMISSVSFRHIGASNICRQVIKKSNAMVKRAPVILDHMRRWESLQLNKQDQLDYARQANDLNPTTINVDPERLIQPRRYADTDGGDQVSLWKTFNRVQENIIKGGMLGRNNQGRRRHTRAIKSIDTDVKINRGLWALTERFSINAKPNIREEASPLERIKALIAQYGPKEYANHIKEAL